MEEGEEGRRGELMVRVVIMKLGNERGQGRARWVREEGRRDTIDKNPILLRASGQRGKK